MANNNWFNNGGVWTRAVPWFKNGSVWVPVQSAYFKNGAAWSQYFSAAVPFTPFTTTKNSGSGNEQIPTGATQLVLTVIGPGGIGNGPYQDTFNEIYSSGGGGGGGGRAISIIPIAAGDWLNTIAWQVATSGGQSYGIGSVVAGSFDLRGNTGGVAGAGTSGGGGIGGSGGTATGGNSNNDTGQSGDNGNGPNTSSQSGGNGGSFYSAGGRGADSPGGSADPGAAGQVIFAWT